MSNEKNNAPDTEVQILLTELEEILTEEIPAEEIVSQPEETPEAEPTWKIPVRRRKREDPVVIGLMFGVSFLCLCITGVMIYWLSAFLG